MLFISKQMQVVSSKTTIFISVGYPMVFEHDNHHYLSYDDNC